MIIVVPSASRKDIWISRDGGGSLKLGSVMNTKVSGLRVNLRVESNVLRLVSPGAVVDVVIIGNYFDRVTVKEKIGTYVFRVAKNVHSGQVTSER